MNKLFILGIILVSIFTYSQVGIGTESPHPSALLEISSDHQGLLPPRLSTAQRDAIVSPATGLFVINTDLNSLDYYNGVNWIVISDTGNSGNYVGNFASLDCTNVINNGTLTEQIPASSVNSSVPYIGGDGGAYPPQSFSSTGVLGLTANLAAGNYNNGNGNLLLSISGIPSTYGNAVFQLSISGQNCSFMHRVNPGPPKVTQLNCNTAIHTGSLVANESLTGVTSIINYTGGNTGVYGNLSFNSSGVEGLTATLAAGTLNEGNGELTFTITGTPLTAGIANFQISFGGQTCSFSREIISASSIPTVQIGTQTWMTHNLGANYSLDPHTPVQAIHGNYYQWGKKAVMATAYSTTGSIPVNNTSTTINAWNSGTVAAPIKTSNDPCPSGFRVPTNEEWNYLDNITTKSFLGTWNNTPENFGAARVLSYNGNKLTMPAAGSRNSSSGVLSERALYGYYWSSDQHPTLNTYARFYQVRQSSTTNTSSQNKLSGYSVRCIKE